MATNALLLLGVVLGVSLLFFVRHWLDLRALRRGVQAFLREEPLPRRLSFLTERGLDVWRLIVTLSKRQQMLGTEKTSFEQALTMSSRFVGETDDLSSVAKEVSTMLLEETKPDAVATAVILADPQTRELKLEYLAGLPALRLQEALLMYADSIFDSNQRELFEHQNLSSAESTWGFHAAIPGTVFDFTTFDIDLSLGIPLQNSEGICGLLWLGFKKHAMSFTAQRRAFVYAIAKHAASSFYAATKVRQKHKEHDSEKDFLLGLSHDLRAPGNSALYALRDLVSGELGPLSAEQHLRLSIIERSLEEQLGILGDVLDFTKFQKGFLHAKKQSVTVESTLQRTIESFALHAERKNLSFSTERLPEGELNVDPRHLQRIIANFISNAIKYTDQGGISISFSSCSPYLEILVSDTGVGISEEEEKFLFQQFSRLHAEHSNEQGFGLGLALSKALAELNNSYVRYERNLGGGSIFVVGVPFVSAKKRIFPLPSVKKALIIDDDEATCRTNKRYLQNLAAEILIASSLAEAQFILDTEEIELVITDLNLPDGSTVPLIKGLEQRSKMIPVIIVTGSGYSPNLEASKSRNVIWVLEKPVNRITLEGAIASLYQETAIA